MGFTGQRYTLIKYTREPDHPVLKQWQVERKYTKLNDTAAWSYAKGVKQCTFRKALVALTIVPYITLKETAREKWVLHLQENAGPPSYLLELEEDKPAA